MSNPPLQTISPESWEAKHKQLIEEEHYKKLSPEEQKKLLKDEQEKFNKSKDSLRADLGFKPFQAPSSKEDTLKKAEEQTKAKEMAEMEKLLEGGAVAGAGAALLTKPKNQKSPEAQESQKKFLAFFDQCNQDINSKKAFNFDSLALDDFGRKTLQTAKITKITDHSEQNDFSSATIRDRIIKDQTSPEHLGLIVEIGNVSPNNINLQNITLEISMTEISDGSFLKKIEQFTSYVLFAMLAYYQKEQRNKTVPHQPKTQNPTPKESKPISDQLKKTGMQSLIEGGEFHNNGALETGNTSTVTFSCNNGSVWGTFDSHNSPKNPKELQEALDKINQEQ